MKEILANLNPEQKKAVRATEGPVLIIAGAGSGKTRVLAHRIAFLIYEKQIKPYNILAVTFTNKAADEMRTRVAKLLGREEKEKAKIIPFLGTFHSICVRILREESKTLGYKSNFAIFDATDQKTAIKKALKKLQIDPKQYAPELILNIISNAKNELIDAKKYAQYATTHFQEIVLKVYVEYQKILDQNQGLDFDDLIMRTVELFQKYPKILKKWQSWFKYVLVDEYQDTNRAQYVLVKMLAQKYKNICVVGDADQCLPKGSKIQSPKGKLPIEQIKKGDLIKSAIGYGKSDYAKVTKIFKKKYSGKILTIKTKKGYQIKVTPNHMMFGKLRPAKNQYYVYLMYRKNKGYRIGITQGVRSMRRSKDVVSGLQVRANQERADKIWILEVCDDISTAYYLEQFLAAKYGLPTMVFHNAGRSMRLKQKHIDRLYQAIDTEKRAKNLFKDLGLFYDYPHHWPQNLTIKSSQKKQDRKKITLVLFGDYHFWENQGWHAHRIALTSSDKKLKNKLLSQFKVRPDRNSWRIETSRKHYKDAINFVEKLANKSGLEVVRKARLVTGENAAFYFWPASHIKKGMIVPIYSKGKIVEDKVIKAETEDFRGEIYDLSTDEHHNYIADGVVVHNSIYGWRGADIRNILNFESDFPKTKVIKLEQNYRSTKKILQAAHQVISKNMVRKEKQLWTENEDGLPVTIYNAKNEKDEADFIIREIEDLKKDSAFPISNYKDFVILYRTNAQSRALEEIFLKYGVPYKIVGGVKFYSRKEIKDILAFLRMIANFKDSVAVERIINVPPRGITPVSWQKIDNLWAEFSGEPEQLKEKIKDLDTLHPRAKKSVLRFLELLKILREAGEKLNVLELIDFILQATKYKDYILDGTIEGESRWENVQELKSVAEHFSDLAPLDGLAAFLEEVSLVADIDTWDPASDAVTLMTAHNAKGLEFGVVFMAGMEEALFPHSKSLMEPTAMEEERRLCYVGMTRAKKRLYMVHAKSRLLYGGIQVNLPSRFIGDVPEEIIESSNVKAQSSNEIKKFKNNKLTEDFKEGDKIEHSKFGQGVIVQIDGDGDTAQVAFAGKGVKKLSLSVAPLKKIK